MHLHSQYQGGEKEAMHSAPTAPPRQILKNSDAESESFAEGSIVSPGIKASQPLSPTRAWARPPPKESQAPLPASQPKTVPAMSGACETELPGEGRSPTTDHSPQAGGQCPPLWPLGGGGDGRTCSVLKENRSDAWQCGAH